MTDHTDNLPPLPETSFLGDSAHYGYDAHGMRDYAREAVKRAALSAPAPAVGEITSAYGTCAISGPREDVSFILRHLPDVDDPAPDAQAAERVREIEDLLRSACAIAERKGVNTAWERFAAGVHALGLNGVTARVYKVLPSDPVTPDAQAAEPVAFTDAMAEAAYEVMKQVATASQSFGGMPSLGHAYKVLEAAFAAAPQPTAKPEGSEAQALIDRGRTEAAGAAQQGGVQEALDYLASLADFAYGQGFHELGYDPVAVVRDALAQHSQPEPAGDAVALTDDQIDQAVNRYWRTFGEPSSFADFRALYRYICNSASAALARPALAAEPAAFDIELEDAASRALLALLGPDPETGECSSVRLQFGDGHSGVGLYLSHPDYPEEGAVFLAAKPEGDE